VATAEQTLFARLYCLADLLQGIGNNSTAAAAETSTL